jgi:hypothetical protein
VSVHVALAELADHVRARRFGYLLTVGEDGRAKAVALVPDVIDGVLVFDAGGGRTLDNLRARPGCSVVFAPTDHEIYSLVVDGDASVVAASSDGRPLVEVRPTSAVLHRPAPGMLEG